jgi:hypothetical protein
VHMTCLAGRVLTDGAFEGDSWPHTFPVDTPVRYASRPWVATVTQGYTASIEGVSTGNAHSPEMLRFGGVGFATSYSPRPSR